MLFLKKSPVKSVLFDIISKKSPVGSGNFKNIDTIIVN